MPASGRADASAVIVVGSVNRDSVIRVKRLPGAGETVIGGTFSEGLGGKGANQAVAAARLGARTTLVACVGRDPAGEVARAALAALGVDIRNVTTVEGRTGVAMIVVDDRGENQIAVASGVNDSLTAPAVTSAIASVNERAAVVLANLEVPDAAVLAAARAAADREFRFVLNPAPARPLPGDLVPLCDVVTPNELEMTVLAPDADALLSAGARAVVVTRGARGALLHRAGERPRHYPAARANVVDATGAGDAFSAALAVALSLGEPLHEAVRWGVAAGALATEAVGAQSSLPDRGAVEARLAGPAAAGVGR